MSGKQSSWSRFAALAVILISLNAAGILWIRASLPEPESPRAVDAAVRLVQVSPAPGALLDDTARVSFEFDRAMVGAADVGTPVTAPPVEIVPPLAGTWVYATPERLDFVLHEPPAPGLTWRGIPRPDARTLAGDRIIAPDDLEWHSRRLEVEACELDLAATNQLRVRLAFNQPVAPDDLAAHLIVSPDGSLRPLPFEIESSDDPTEHIVVLSRSGDRALAVTLDEHLHGAEGHRTLATSYTARFDVPTELAVLGCSSSRYLQRHGRRSTVWVRFSRSLDVEQPVPPITVTPTVEEFTIRLRNNNAWLSGGFEPGRRYAISIPAGIRDTEGQCLAEPRTLTWDAPQREPTLDMSSGHGILSPRGTLLVDVTAAALDAIDIRVDRVHENTLVAHLQGHRARYTTDPVVHTTKHLDVADRDVTTDVALDLRALVPQPRGVHRLRLSAHDRWYPKCEQLLNVTDVTLTTIRDATGVVVWATSIVDGAPVDGAAITVRSITNQPLATGTTDGDGLARLALPTGDDVRPWIATATTADGDLAYTLLEQTRAAAPGVDLSGRHAPASYDLFLTPERELARPGDALRCIGILRDRDGTTPATFPIEIRLHRPDGREVARTVVTPDASGYVLAAFETEPDAVTGTYAFSARVPGASSALARAAIAVEHFQPVRLTVDATPAPDAPLALDVTARYLWDAPAADLPLRITGTFRAERFQSAAEPTYSFDPPSAQQHVLAAHDAELDATGAQRVTLTPPEDLPPARWQLPLSATVTEIGGRSVTAHAALLHDSHGRHLGVRVNDAAHASTDAPVAIDWLLRDGTDTPLEAREITVTAQRVTREWVLRNVNGAYAWTTVETRHDAPAPTLERRATTETPGRVSFQADVPGTYRLTLTESGDTPGSRTIDITVRSRLAATTDRPRRPELIELIGDQPAWRAGETAQITVRPPFAGTLLLTIESNVVHHATVQTIDAEDTTIALPIPADLRGGAFLCAALVRPVDVTATEWMPHRARGVMRIPIDHTAQRLELAISGAERAQPSDSVALTIDSGGVPILAWAVDEAILQCTAMETPDPFAHFFAPRTRTTATADRGHELRPDYQRPATVQRIGGDVGMTDRVRRRVPARYRDALVLAPRVLTPDADGIVRWTFAAPTMNGALRVMTIGADGDRYGAAEHALVITPPLMVESAWPRAVAPGDHARIPVTLTNHTDHALSAALAVHCADAAVTISGTDAPIEIAAHATARTWLTVDAVTLGAVTVALEARADTPDGSLVGTFTADFAVRPAEPLVTQVVARRVPVGEPLELAVGDDFLPAFRTSSVRIGATPFLELEPALRAVVDYPYGCIEQTSSRLLALLAADRGLGTLDGAAARSVRLDMINAGIRHLRRLQRVDGAFSYWSGAYRVSPWGTAYAVSVLQRARAEGFTVPPALLRDAIASLDDLRDVRSLDGTTRALIARVRAVDGTVDHVELNWLHERAETLSPVARAHLAHAWRAAGDLRRARDLLSIAGPMPRDDASVMRPSAPARDLAALLDATVAIDPESAAADELATALLARRHDGRWSSTLGDAGALWALTRYHGVRLHDATFTGTVSSGAQSKDVSDHATFTLDLADDALPVVLETTGSGHAIVTTTTRGVLARGAAESTAHGVRVERRWLDRAGREVDPTALRVGDLVIVEVTIRSTTGRSVHRVAVVDRLPGGMEVEHPKLATSDRSTEGGTWSTTRAAFLDDRVALFGTATAGPRSARYALRVTTAGSFTIPPIEATCMDDERLCALDVTDARLEVAP